MSLENKKIDFYMYLWESFNKTITIEDFEKKIEKFIEEKTKYEDRGAIYIPVLKDFFLAHNIELYSTEENLFNRKKLLKVSENIFIDFLIKKINSLSKVFFEVDGKEDVKIIKENTVKSFFAMFDSSGLDKKEIIEVIKAAVRLNLKLSNKDAIFLVNQKMLVRYFREDESEKAKRYGGIPGNELERIYKERSEDYYNQCCIEVVKQLTENELNFKKINNVFFHQNYIKLVQKTLSEQLLKDFLQNPSLLPAFTNYVFRIFFDAILMGLADVIINLVIEGNSNIKNFISFYDGKELYLDQNVIKKPVIMANGDSWSFLSISAVAKDREKAREIYEKERVEVDRVSFLVNKMKQSKEKLEKTRAELDSLPDTPTDTTEYKYIVLDIEIGGKEIARREEILKELEVKVAPFRKEFELYEEKLYEIKKGLVATIGGFRI